MVMGQDDVARLRMKARRNALTEYERCMFFDYLMSDSSLQANRETRSFDIAWLKRERALICQSRSSNKPDRHRSNIIWSEEQQKVTEKQMDKAVHRLLKRQSESQDVSEESIHTSGVSVATWWAKINDIVNQKTVYSPEMFFEERNSYKGHMQDFDFMGCYVIYNLTKDLYYVGQAKHVPNRVNAHFSGRGNGDVYADFKYGDQFEICLVDIMDTEYRRLDDLERDLITRFDAFAKGYNKTRGNA